jgi:hypothetical protein
MFRWLKKNKQKPQMESDQTQQQAGREDRLQLPLAAEIENMVIVQPYYSIASVCAENVARAKVEGRLKENWALCHLRRYIRLRTECIEVTRTITNPFYRAVAINFLVDLCMKARDVEDARAILKYQHETHFREAMVSKYPELVLPMADYKPSPMADSSRSNYIATASAKISQRPTGRGENEFVIVGGGD